MPYTYKKEGDKYVVYKKDGGKRVGATKGTKEALKKYLAALHMHEMKLKEKENNEKIEEIDQKSEKEIILQGEEDENFEKLEII